MIVSQTEAQPASYPTVTGLSTEAAALDAPSLWQRIEHYISHRWETREVVWIVDAETGGREIFQPPLKPFTIDTTEKWDGDSYETVTLDAAPYGLSLESGIYKITATVGDTADPPEAITEAFRRLAEYTADGLRDQRVNTSQNIGMGDALSRSIDRPAYWQARALQHSGAADLLRAYR